jgi:hypothetical protein
MCMISNEIESVSNTKILVAPNSDKTNQLTVYSNYVSNISESNAMVLPVPFPQTLQFIDLSAYSNLFEDCAKCFYSPYKSKSINFSTNSFNTKDDKPLQVFNVGSYKVSVAMNLEQIGKVDSRVFKLSPGLAQTLNTFYYQPYWGFIICKLNSGHETYHPIAYSHQIIDSKIYIPTRHYHQEVKWEDANNWALGTHLDPKQNPLNMRSWTEDNINQSPMFRTEHFERTSPEANGWANMVRGMGSDNIGMYSSNQFETPEFIFEDSQCQSRTKTQTQAQAQAQAQAQNPAPTQHDSNSFARMSSRYDNLRKLNDSKYSKSTDYLQHQQSNIAYKNIADDWSHSIYLLNLNPNSNPQIKQMNSSKEVWDEKTLFEPHKINFDFGYCDGFTKLKIEGTHPNIDLVIPISA